MLCKTRDVVCEALTDMTSLSLLLLLLFYVPSAFEYMSGHFGWFLIYIPRQ